MDWKKSHFLRVPVVGWILAGSAGAIPLRNHSQNYGRNIYAGLNRAGRRQGRLQNNAGWQKKTYFFDAKESKNSNRYLLITESSQDQTGQRRRNSILLFPNQIEQFQQTLSEMAAQL